MLTVSFHAQGRERLAFWLSNAGAVRVLRGDPRWFDFELVLTAPDGRLVDRADPLRWALALQRAYANTPLTVTLAVTTEQRPGPASDRGGPPAFDANHAPLFDAAERKSEPSARRRFGRALGAGVVSLLAVLAASLAFAAGGIAPTDARSATVTPTSAKGSGFWQAAHRDAAVPTAPSAPRSPFANAAAQGMAELAGLSEDSSTVNWDQATGLWGAHSSWGGAQSPAWWQSALATWALVRYLQATHSSDPRYQHVLDETFNLGVSKPGTHMPLNFANQFMDDTGWWALAWLAAARYELAVRHDDSDAARFLAVSEWDAEYIARQPRSCGGIVWKLGTRPDTIASAEYIALTAQLYSARDAPGIWHDDTKASMWLTDADWALDWLEQSGLVNMRAGTVLDTLGGDCEAQGAPLTYTEGEVADALIQLGSATRENSYFRQARAFLNYTMGPESGMTSSGGVLQEGCETGSEGCQGTGEFNTASFKGIFVQAVSDYDQASASNAYRAYLQAQARAILQNSVSDGQGTPARCDSPHDCQFGFYWSAAVNPSSAPVGVSLATQTSALDALTAALNA